MFGQLIDPNYPLCNNYGIFTASCNVAGYVEGAGWVLFGCVAYFAFVWLSLHGQKKLKIGPWKEQKTKL